MCSWDLGPQLNIHIDALDVHEANSFFKVVLISHYRLSLERSVLLKQQLSKMTVWLKKAEQKMEKEDDVGPNYDIVKKQLEDHQVITKFKLPLNLKVSFLRTERFLATRW